MIRFAFTLKRYLHVFVVLLFEPREEIAIAEEFGDDPKRFFMDADADDTNYILVA